VDDVGLSALAQLSALGLAYLAQSVCDRSDHGAVGSNGAARIDELHFLLIALDSLVVGLRRTPRGEYPALARADANLARADGRPFARWHQLAPFNLSADLDRLRRVRILSGVDVVVLAEVSPIALDQRGGSLALATAAGGEYRHGRRKSD
jgi:hypothetical protein